MTLLLEILEAPLAFCPLQKLTQKSHEIMVPGSPLHGRYVEVCFNNSTNCVSEVATSVKKYFFSWMLCMIDLSVDAAFSNLKTIAGACNTV